LVPEARVEEVIASAFGAITIAVAADFACAGLPLSTTLTVKFDVPLADGVPDITPVLAARVRPVGRLPDVIDQL
jgi:hypothetical protein